MFELNTFSTQTQPDRFSSSSSSDRWGGEGEGQLLQRHRTEAKGRSNQKVRGRRRDALLWQGKSGSGFFELNTFSTQTQPDRFSSSSSSDRWGGEGEGVLLQK